MRTVFAALLTAALLPAATANAAVITLGSTLAAPATQTEAHGQDTAFWMTQVGGQSGAMPEDGQVVSITTKGSVLQEEGAGPPANMVHFQSLVPGRGNQTEVLLTSGWHELPISQPHALKTYELYESNLCVKKGGFVALNNIGGFQYGGALDKVDPAHYQNGAPFQIFAPVADSTTMRYSHHNGTNNGATLNPDAGSDKSKPNGSVNTGQEMLMQYRIATGDDRSEACGGPRRHADGTLVDVTPDGMHMTVTKFQGSEQMPYVSAHRKFAVGVYCGGETEATCRGRGRYVFSYIDDKGKKRYVRKTSRIFRIPALKSGRINFILDTRAYEQLLEANPKRFAVTFLLKGNFPIVKVPLTLMQ